MTPISEYRHELFELITKSIVDAIKFLKERLPDGGVKFAAVLSLEGRLNEANKSRLFGTISDQDLQIIYNQIRKALIDQVSSLTDADFQETSTSESSKSNTGKGSILYRIPNTMEVGVENKCVVRIAIDKETIIQNIELDQHVQLKDIRVSDVMMVELVDPSGDAPFAIRNLNSPEQFIDPNEHTEWIFMVRPLLEGTYPLMIKVAVIELVYEKERRREIVLEERIQIVTNTIDEEPTPEFRSSGYEINVGTNVRTLPTEKPHLRPKLMVVSRRYAGLVARSMALLIFLFGTFGAYAYPSERDWLITRYIQDSAVAYGEYAEDYQLSRHREKAVWQKAVIEDTPPSYIDYLEDYPRGQQRQTAIKALQRLDRIQFQLIQQSNQVENIRDYLNWFAHPAYEGQFLTEVERLAIRYQLLAEYNEIEFEALTTEQREQAFWRFIQDQPSRGALYAYIKLHPNGSHILEAKRQYGLEVDAVAEERLIQESKMWSQVAEVNKKYAYIRYLERFPSGAYREQAKMALSDLGEPIPAWLSAYDKPIDEGKTEGVSEETTKEEESAGVTEVVKDEKDKAEVVDPQVSPTARGTTEEDNELLTVQQNTGEKLGEVRTPKDGKRLGEPSGQAESSLPKSFEVDVPTGKKEQLSLPEQQKNGENPLPPGDIANSSKTATNPIEASEEKAIETKEKSGLEPQTKDEKNSSPVPLGKDILTEKGETAPTEDPLEIESPLPNPARPNKDIQEKALKYMGGLGDENAWKHAKRLNRIMEYEYYLKLYPDGKYKYEAKDQIEELFWSWVLKLNTSGAMAAYIKRFPTGLYVAEATNSKEDLFWQEMLANRDSISITRYLKAYPQGKYVQRAEDSFEEIDRSFWQESSTKGGLREINDYIKRFPQGRFIEEAMVIKEQKLWEFVFEQFDSSGMMAYLEKYPNGTFVDRAKGLLDTIHWSHYSTYHKGLTLYQQKYPEGGYIDRIDETSYFLTQKEKNTKASFQRYLTKYPTGHYIVEANREIEQLDWASTLQQNTEAAYRNYLKIYPSGTHRWDASNKIEDFVWKRISEKEDYRSFEAYLVDYKSGKYVQLAKERVERHYWRQAVQKGQLEDYHLFVKNHAYQEEYRQLGQKRVDSLFSISYPLAPQVPKEVFIEKYLNYQQHRSNYYYVKEVARDNYSQDTTNRRWNIKYNKLKALDGATYETIQINGKTWLAENLNESTSTSRAHNDDPILGFLYGRKYSWSEAQSLCANLGKGWRLPKKQEWEGLIRSYGGFLKTADQNQNENLVKQAQIAYGALIISGKSGFRAISGKYWTSNPLKKDDRAWLFNFRASTTAQSNTNYRVVLRETQVLTNTAYCRCVKE